MSHTGVVERVNLVTHYWESLNTLLYPREFPKAIASHRHKQIYIFGGCQKRSDNYLIENYDASQLEDIDITRVHFFEEQNKNKWTKSVMVNTTLNKPFEASRSHLVLTDDNAYFEPKDSLDEFQKQHNTDDRGRLETDYQHESEKIFIIQYGSLFKPLPHICTYNTLKDSLSEVKYNKLASET